MCTRCQLTRCTCWCRLGLGAVAPFVVGRSSEGTQGGYQGVQGAPGGLVAPGVVQGVGASVTGAAQRETSHSSTPVPTSQPASGQPMPGLPPSSATPLADPQMNQLLFQMMRALSGQQPPPPVSFFFSSFRLFFNLDTTWLFCTSSPTLAHIRKL